MSKFLMSVALGLAIMSPIAVFLMNGKPMRVQWETIKLGAEVWKDALLGKRSLP